MPRTARFTPGGFAYYVINRGAGPAKLFRSAWDHQVFQKCITDALDDVPVRLLGYCVLANHWELLVWPRHDGDMSKFVMCLTNRHVRQWTSIHKHAGIGHLYEGRYRSFAVQDDEHLLTVARYVEGASVRLKLAERAEEWAWSSVGQWRLVESLRVKLTDSPVPRPDDWPARVNQPLEPDELKAFRTCLKHAKPYGDPLWLKTKGPRLNWREPGKPGRPRKIK